MADLNLTTVEFGKSKYHLQDTMIRWCRDHIGEGRWLYSTPRTWEGMGISTWAVCTMFGTTFFTFKHEHHASAFILKWSGDEQSDLYY